MPSSRRAAFTFVDLLMVVCVIVVLLALLLPDLASIMDRGRRLDCENRMRQIGVATSLFQTNFHSFPGYWMPTSATKPTGSTWPLTLAKQLGRDDLWHAWTEGNGLPATLYWDNMVCPSNAPKKLDAHWLSYVVNCGLYKNNKNIADGVCFDQLAKPAGPKTTSDSLRAGKGSAKTLFATENTLDIVSANTDGWLQKTSAGALQFTGFCWQAVNTPNAAQQINVDKANPKPPLPKTALTDYARPASNHPGGVNVVFCDGHVQFLRDDVKYSVYQLLMATDPKKADFPAGSAAIGYTLKEGDY